MSLKRVAAALLLLAACTGGARSPALVRVALGGPGGIPIAGGGFIWAVQGPRPSLIRIDAVTGRYARLPLPSTAMFGRVAYQGSAVWVPSCDPASLRGDLCLNTSLLKLDPATARLRATIPVGSLGEPSFLVAGDGAVWIQNSPRQLTRVDVGTDASRVVMLPEEGSPVGAGLGSVWIARGSRLLRLDGATGAERATLPIQSTEVALSRNAVWAIGSSIGRNTLYRVDPGTNAIVASILLPGYFEVATDGPLVWLGGRSTPLADAITVLRVDPQANRIAGAPISIVPSASPLFLTAGLGNWHVFTAALDRRLWLTNQTNGEIVGVTDAST